MEHINELLIELVERNEDHSWLPAFLKLREGSYLPQGGAGSLIDWGPFYNNPLEDVWYSRFYDLFLNFYFDRSQSLSGKAVISTVFIECNHCKAFRKNEKSVESIGVDYFLQTEEYMDLLANSPTQLFDKTKTYNSNKVILFREELFAKLKEMSAAILENKQSPLVCPKCEAKEFNHVKFEVQLNPLVLTRN